MNLNRTELKVLRNIISFSDYNFEEVAETEAEARAFDSLKKKGLIGL